MRRAVVVGSGCNAAYPDRLPVTGPKLRIVYKKLVAVKRNALDYVFVKRNIRGIKPIDRDAAKKLSRFVIKCAVNSADIKINVVPGNIAVLGLKFFLVVRARFNKPLGRIVYKPCAIDPDDEKQHDGTQDQHHCRYPNRQPELCRHPQSSLSTQPMPQTVCISFLSKPSSIFLRR